VVVNVAAFEAFLVRKNKRVWSARVQVGKPLRRTPIFRSTLSYLVLNPTWTVPPSIIEQDILPEAKKSVKAITRRHLKVYDRSGRELNPAGVPWRKLRADRFPYVLRQDPGPRNSLGRVKLMFPNDYAVYMHDTPAQELFTAGERNFSSGCVRVERPLELAQLLLDDPAKWGEAQIAKVVASEETTHVSLPKKLPVLLVYWTAWVDDQQRANFRRDAYEHDAAWLKQLRGGFVIRKRSLLALSSEPAAPSR
jgi:murein L,D-transpeptidase YcbB/YkuD